METITIKQELIRMIEAENDPAILESIKDLLNPILTDPILEEKMISRALKAEEDIKAGRVYSEEDFFNKWRVILMHHSISLRDIRKFTSIK